MRILLLSHYYEPEIGAPQRRWRGLVEQFVAAGHCVAVCAPVAHYPHRRAEDLERVSVDRERGTTSQRGNLLRWREGARGERVLRVPYVPVSGSLPGQMVDQAVSSAAMAVVGSAMRGARPDVVVSTTPGLPMPFAGDSVARSLGVPHVAEIRDAWPDLIADSGLVRKATGGVLPRALVHALESRVLPSVFESVLRRADAVVTTTSGFSTRLRSRGIGPVITIRNTSDVIATRTAAHHRHAGADLHVLYVGTVGRSQGLETAIRATARVPGVRLRIVGAGAQWEALRDLASGLTDRIVFFPQTTGPDLEEHWAWAHTGLVSLADVPAYEVTVPSKLVSVMARRIHVTGVLAGEAAGILRDAGAGHSVPPGDEDRLSGLLADLRDDPAATRADDRPLAWLRENASPRAAADDYLDVLQDVTR